MRRVKRTTSLGAGIVAFAALVSIARADDSPGLALAKNAIEAERGTEHREKMRIVWPEIADETPPAGTEVTLISGYIDYDLTRLVCSGKAVDATSVYTARTWFYNPKGEALEAGEFDVDAKAFTDAWNAARHLLEAKDERIEPEATGDPDDRGGAASGSHESHRWVRLRLPGRTTPLHHSDQRGMSWRRGNVRRWTDIRDYALFQLFGSLVPTHTARRRIEAAAAAGFITEEVRRAAKRLDLEYRGEHTLLLETCLRIAGDVGDADTLAAVESLETALAADPRDDWDATTIRENLADEFGIARTKLSLRLDWSAERARTILGELQVKTKGESDLLVWIRRRWRASAPVDYLKFVVEERPTGTAAVRADLARTLDEIRTSGAQVDPAALRPHFADTDAQVRLAAARAVLAVSEDDRAALSAIVDLARDPSIRVDRSGDTPTGVRLDALAEVGARRLVPPGALRAMLAAEVLPDGLLVQALLDALARSDEPPSPEETLAAWRRTLEQSPYGGLDVGIAKLIDLRDVESRPRMAVAIQRLKSVNVRCRSVDPAVLAERLAREMPEAPAPK
jgi:hypothetical protein